MEKITMGEALEIAWDTLEKAEYERRQADVAEAEIGVQYLEQLWLVGQAYTDYHPQAWEFVGIFSTKEKAIQACHNYRYFITPIEIDKAAPLETTPLPNCFFPKGEGFPE